jgi:hypothetical protein
VKLENNGSEEHTAKIVGYCLNRMASMSPKLLQYSTTSLGSLVRRR